MNRFSGRVGIVGAGVSGLTCARRLVAHGCRVTILEKSRGPGGRASTRRHEADRFDHGAQYFTVRDSDFASQVQAWREAGAVARWDARIVDLAAGSSRAKKSNPARFVGLPGMSGIGRHLAESVDVRFRCRITEIVPGSDCRWALITDGAGSTEPFDIVVLTPPAPQTAALLGPLHPRLAAQVAVHEMQPCWAVMIVYDTPLPLLFDGAFVQASSLAWVARDSSKPGRPDGERWMLHAGAEWSESRLDAGSDDVISELLSEFADATGANLPAPRRAEAHLWRFARSKRPGQHGCLYDADECLGVCGDWLQGDRLEGAFRSGRALADRILGFSS